MSADKELAGALREALRLLNLIEEGSGPCDLELGGFRTKAQRALSAFDRSRRTAKNLPPERSVTQILADHPRRDDEAGSWCAKCFREEGPNEWPCDAVLAARAALMEGLAVLERTLRSVGGDP